MKEEEFFIMLQNVLCVVERVEYPRFLSFIFLLRCGLIHLVWCKYTEYRIVGFKCYFCVHEMRVHEDDPVTVYPECEFSPLASGVVNILLLLSLLLLLLLLLFFFFLLLFLSSPLAVSFRLAPHLLF